MKKFIEFWSLGRDIAIKKTICRFQRRSFNTLVILIKLIKKGYKIWVLI